MSKHNQARALQSIPRGRRSSMLQFWQRASIQPTMPILRAAHSNFQACDPKAATRCAADISEGIHTPGPIEADTQLTMRLARCASRHPALCHVLVLACGAKCNLQQQFATEASAVPHTHRGLRKTPKGMAQYSGEIVNS